MAAESNPNRDAPKLDIESSDFDAMLREQLREPPPSDGAEPEADKPERTDLREPEIKVEPAVTVSEPPSGRPSPTEPSDEVTRALSTISRLEAQVRELQTQQRETWNAPTAARREPQIEFAEVIPGLTLPKDQKLWPVQLTPDLVKAAGLDPEVAPGLNILANAFLLHINNLLTPQILNQVDMGQRSRETASASVNAFFTRFPDLRDKQDLLELVEARARDADRIHEKFVGSDYMDQLGTRTRQRLAALRGQSLEQYTASLNTNAVTATQSGSRASTSPVRRVTRPGVA